jgi:hypothetical protein
MITFFSQLTQPHYEAWQSAGAPAYIPAPEYPRFSTRIVHKDGYFTIETWEASFVSVQGRDFRGQSFRPVFAIRYNQVGTPTGARRLGGRW